MLHLFRRNGMGDGPPLERSGGSIVVSHILTKFLKRLHHIDRPRLLDLGRLSGSNIEFFAQRGCRVQVEDLLLALEGADETTGRPHAGPGAAPGESPAGDDHETEAGIVVASDLPAAPTAPDAIAAAPSEAPAGSAAAQVPRLSGLAAASASPGVRPGSRPTRRIVLPPRTFASRTSPATQATQGGRRIGASDSASALTALLPTTFSYADETFDALVAWDIFNFYDPGRMTLLAAEARRVLKPGGLLLGYFHARRSNGPETPGRYRILDEGRVACDGQPGPTLRRHVYQNRDIEKMFLGLSIVELYFLKNATREILMEKKTARPPIARSPVRAATPKPRFTIE
jgi:hypothetical protein